MEYTYTFLLQGFMEKTADYVVTIESKYRIGSYDIGLKLIEYKDVYFHTNTGCSRAIDYVYFCLLRDYNTKDYKCTISPSDGTLFI